MTDRELIELAAKAAGVVIHHWSDGRLPYGCPVLNDGINEYIRVFDPLADDGDALRLAVKLELNLRINKFPHVVYVEIYNGRAPSVMEPLSDVRQPTPDPQVATRRAITRAAAEIGRGMK